MALRIGDKVKSWAGVGKITYIRNDKVKVRLLDGTLSKFMNITGLKKVR
jgi:preprotein translocase subunit YajC